MSNRVAKVMRQVFARRIKNGVGDQSSEISVLLAYLTNLNGKALTDEGAARVLVDLLCDTGLAAPEPPTKAQTGVLVLRGALLNEAEWAAYWAASERWAKEQTERMKIERSR